MMKLVEDVRRAEQALEAIESLAAAGEAFLERQTRIEQYLRGFTVNDVLWSGSISLAANGTWQKSFTVDFAALSIVNLTAVTVDFASRPLPSAFVVGPGMFQLPSLAMLTVPAVGRTVSVWTDQGSTPAPPVLVVVSAAPLQPNGATL